MSPRRLSSEQFRSEDGLRQNQRLRLNIRGLVQGVGFRPFVYRLATNLGLTGWVCNSPRGLQIDLEGPRDKLDTFLSRLYEETPPQASVQAREATFLPVIGYSGFEVRESPDTGVISTPVLPDMGTCQDCLREIFDPANRRYRYPFTNCTNCGPRYSIVESLPYDRARTTMKAFEMCEECRAEYDDPGDRRFHAQPNACQKCGPRLQLWDCDAKVLALSDSALRKAGANIRSGKILALKGLGGYQLLVDATNEEAVLRLRKRKARVEKPLALMYPDMAAVRRDCEVSELEQQLLLSPEAPIVLLQRRIVPDDIASRIACSVAPDNPYLGIMLPYTPLHHLLMHGLGFPVVATSGNLSDEPICINEQEALDRLGNIADMFLIHDRPITRQVDDSVVQIVNGGPQITRNARGYAPSCIPLKKSVEPILAVGAHDKNSTAIATGQQVFVSQHIGDLETPSAYNALNHVVKSLSDLYKLSPLMTVCDAHPDYASTQFAHELGLPIVRVQHHYAHVLSCMADNEIEGPVLGVAWDGSGLGSDGTIWGGEFLRIDKKSFTRTAHFRTFRLPGNETAIREPRRSAIGLLYEIFGDDLFDRHELEPLTTFDNKNRTILQQMLVKQINSPITSSAGRLFDAVASILKIRNFNAYSGQAAMMLEFAAIGAMSDETYPFSLVETENCYCIDWELMILNILDDLKKPEKTGKIAAKFHNSLAEMIVAVAKRVGEERIVLTGGCFQNRYLAERTVLRLEEAGFKPYWHHRAPPGDGGIALGQIMAAIHHLDREE